MTIRRASGALLLISALTGSLAQWRLPPRVPPRVGEFVVLAADLHVHGFPGDGALPAWNLRDEARRRGLDVIALTNHNQRLAGRIGRWIAGNAATPLVLSAEEITARHYHIVAVGLERTIEGTLPAAGAIAAVHAQGGVAIAAHPSRQFWRGYDAGARATLDGAEIAHPMIAADAASRAHLIEFTRSTRELNADLAPIGSTDFHYRQPMGMCRTYLFAREYSEAGVLEAIRSGRTVALDPDGRTYGEPALVEAVERVRAAVPPPTPWRTLADRVSGPAAMLGLLGLLLLKRSDHPLIPHP